MILLIDNYDSFSYNLYQYIGTLDPDIRVVRNDELTVSEIRALGPSHIVLSPGPGRPADAGVCERVAKELASEVPTLGVCLGHQAICEAHGARIGYAKQLMHGKQSRVHVNTETRLFAGLPETIEAARYHSLAVDEATLPTCLRVTGRTEDGEVMAVEHKRHPLFGVQFHPESIMTPQGMQVLRNFLEVGRM